MKLVLISLAVIGVPELLLWFRPFWRYRKLLASLLMVLAVAITGIALGAYFQVWAVLLVVLGLYRVINFMRLVKGEVHADYLFHSFRKTSAWLLGLQFIVMASAVLINHFSITAASLYYALSIIQALTAAVIALTLTGRLRTIKTPPLSESIANSDLPSLTVMIPARNETEDLQQCLKSLISSTYPKLEILVLDDCSQSRRTPEIIKDFAQDGVRFIAGKEPTSQWLAKNYAYQQLAESANGELLLFCGVDTRFEPNSLTVLVNALLQKHKIMIGVMPINRLSKPGEIKSLIFQPNRYAWEMILPRRLLHRPPVLSTCWLITRQALKQAGGFQAVGRKIVPESYFARLTARQNNGYSFIVSDSALGISTVKSASEQRATAIRVRYPQLHKRPELVLLVGLAELMLLLWPLVMSVIALATKHWLLGAISIIAFSSLAISHSKVINLTYRRFESRGIFILPIAIIYDVALLNYSMWQYEFSEVIWKGRNICVPVMRVVSKLPESH